MIEETDKWGVRTIRADKPEEGRGVLAFHKDCLRPEVRRPSYFGPAGEFQAALLLRGAELADDPEALERREVNAVYQAILRHELIALRMLEAVRDGNAAYFERLADAIRSNAKRPEPVSTDDDRLRRAIAAAAEKAGGKAPFIRDVARAYASIRKTAGVGQTSDSDPEKLKPKLARIDFGWLPAGGRGRPRK